jgi:hypothetical protein
MRFLLAFFLICAVVFVYPQDSAEYSSGKPPPLFPLPEGSVDYLKKNNPVTDSVVIPEKTAPGVPKEQPPQWLIMGKGEIGAEVLASFLLNENKNADRNFVEQLARYYLAEAEIEGVNHDIAFAQMCLETGFLRFGNLVQPEQYNFAGLGATGPGVPGLSFPSPQMGVRAHIQHLKAYGSEDSLNQELINPRFRLVRRGSSPSIQGLAGTWAADLQYAEKIERILQRLYSYGNL